MGEYRRTNNSSDVTKGTGKVRPEQGLLKVRKELGLFGNIRPCNFASESLLQFSPLKPEVAKNTDFIILRELIGGVYFGEKTEDEGSGYACDQMPYHRSEIERVARLAAFLAKQSDPPKAVISIDKANVLATSRLWRKTVTELYEKEFPEIKLSHQLVDSAAMIMVKTPTALNGIVLCENLMGDILSDEASVIPGSLGLLPSASLSAIPGTSDKVAAMYEPCHGTAPDIAGKGIVNPIGMILSVALMLRWSFGLNAEAQAIEDAVRKVIDTPDIGGQGLRTKDLGGRTTTKEITEAICATLKTLL